MTIEDRVRRIAELGFEVEMSSPMWSRLRAGDAGSVRVNGGTTVRETDPAAKDTKNVALAQSVVTGPAVRIVGACSTTVGLKP